MVGTVRQEIFLSEDEEVPRTLLGVHGAPRECVVLEARGLPSHGAWARRRRMRQLRVRPRPPFMTTGRARWWLLLTAMCSCEHHATIAAAT